jgi:hypothetical protein
MLSMLVQYSRYPLNKTEFVRTVRTTVKYPRIEADISTLSNAEIMNE